MNQFPGLDGPIAERAGIHIHLVGIGGAGLSAIATLLLEMGYTVSGSDHRPTEVTAELAAQGATVFSGHRPENVLGSDLILISSAVAEDNPELRAAQAAGIPIYKRAEFMGPLIAGQHGVGVAGTHGKTTTTSMIAIILWRCGFDPSFIIGGRLAVGPGEGMPSTTISARAGRGPFVIEADEYDRMFLGLPVETAVITSVEWDHVDSYPSPKSFVDAFRTFVGQLPEFGHLVLSADDAGALALRDAAPPGVKVQTYGLSEDAGWRAQELRTNQIGGLDAAIWRGKEEVATLSLAVPGRHNVRNALAALVVADWFEIPPARAAIALHDFRGAGRRFEVIGEAGGVTVIDDYAHHPTEIATTLAAARLRFSTRRIWVVFQPHTYSRTKALLDDFARSFDDADEVLLLDIYPAREKVDLGMHSRVLLERMNHTSARYIGSIEEATRHLVEHVAPEDVVITMSAGDGNQVGHLLLAALR